MQNSLYMCMWCVQDVSDARNVLYTCLWNAREMVWSVYVYRIYAELISYTSVSYVQDSPCMCMRYMQGCIYTSVMCARWFMYVHISYTQDCTNTYLWHICKTVHVCVCVYTCEICAGCYLYMSASSAHDGIYVCVCVQDCIYTCRRDACKMVRLYCCDTCKMVSIRVYSMYLRIWCVQGGISMILWHVCKRVCICVLHTQDCTNTCLCHICI